MYIYITVVPILLHQEAIVPLKSQLSYLISSHNSKQQMAKALKAALSFLFFLAIAVTCANSARILDVVDPQPPVITDAPLPSNPVATSVPPTVDDDDESNPQLPEPEAPVAAAIPPIADDDVAPIATPITPVATSSATPLCFFMHDVIGGSHPSARVVTGIIASTEINGIPFSKANSNIFPVNGGTPLLNPSNLNNIINPNNVPFLTGLNGAQTSTVLQNTGTNNVINGDNNQPFVSAGQLPPGSSLQKLMFGSITVIDDELTEGHELGSGVIGKAQGFYLASSLDGTSQTVALTALLHGSEHDHDIVDSISFFGVHRTASPHSQIAVVGGTGKYENAKGYATVETLHQEDQHTTDGVDTIVKFSVYITE